MGHQLRPRADALKQVARAHTAGSDIPAAPGRIAATAEAAPYTCGDERQGRHQAAGFIAPRGREWGVMPDGQGPVSSGRRRLYERNTCGWMKCRNTSTFFRKRLGEALHLKAWGNHKASALTGGRPSGRVFSAWGKPAIHHSLDRVVSRAIVTNHTGMQSEKSEEARLATAQKLPMASAGEVLQDKGFRR